MVPEPEDYPIPFLGCMVLACLSALVVWLALLPVFAAPESTPSYDDGTTVPFKFEYQATNRFSYSDAVGTTNLASGTRSFLDR
jgi:hypothetical protein